MSSSKPQNHAYLAPPCLLGLLLLGYTSSTATATSGPKVQELVAAGAPSKSSNKPARPFDPKRGMALMRSERFGKLHLGLDSRSLARSLGRPEQESPDTFEAATGLYVRQWRYERRGIEVRLVSPKRLGSQRVDAMTFTAPCNLRSTRKIGVGSTADAVRKAYADYLDPATVTSDTMIAGSVYGGIMFHVADGRVDRIFVGAGAE